MRAAAFAFLLLASCGPVRIADRDVGELLFRPGKVTLAVHGEPRQIASVWDAVSWWESRLDLDMAEPGLPGQSDVEVHFDLPGTAIRGECQYLTTPRVVTMVGFARPDIEHQLILHELGHCLAGLPHHWSKASIMYWTIPVEKNAHVASFGSPTRPFYSVLRAEREAVRKAWR